MNKLFALALIFASSSVYRVACASNMEGCLLLYKSTVAVEVALLSVPAKELCEVKDKVAKELCFELVNFVTNNGNKEQLFFNCLTGKQM